MEGVEGVVMAYSTKCLLDELVGRTLPIFAHLPPHRQQCCDRRADFCGGKAGGHVIYDYAQTG